MSKSQMWLAAIIVAIIAALVAVVTLTRDDVPKDAAFVYGDRVVTRSGAGQAHRRAARAVRHHRAEVGEGSRRIPSQCGKVLRGDAHSRREGP